MVELLPWQIALIVIGAVIVVGLAIALPLVFLLNNSKSTPTPKKTPNPPPAPSKCTWQATNSSFKEDTGFPLQSVIDDVHIYAISGDKIYKYLKDLSLVTTSTSQLSNLQCFGIGYNSIFAGSNTGIYTFLNESSNISLINFTSLGNIKSIFVKNIDNLNYIWYVFENNIVYTIELAVQSTIVVPNVTEDFGTAISVRDTTIAYGGGNTVYVTDENVFYQRMDSSDITYGNSLSFGNDSLTLYIGSDLAIEIWVYDGNSQYLRQKTVNIGASFLNQCLNYLYVTVDNGTVKEYLMNTKTNDLEYTGNTFKDSTSKTFGSFVSSLAVNNKVNLYISDVGQNKLSLFKCI
jgi:hypothetical protein